MSKKIIAIAIVTLLVLINDSAAALPPTTGGTNDCDEMRRDDPDYNDLCSSEELIADEVISSNLENFYINGIYINARYVWRAKLYRDWLGNERIEVEFLLRKVTPVCTQSCDDPGVIGDIGLAAVAASNHAQLRNAAMATAEFKPNTTFEDRYNFWSNIYNIWESENNKGIIKVVNSNGEIVGVVEWLVDNGELSVIQSASIIENGDNFQIIYPEGVGSQTINSPDWQNYIYSLFAVRACSIRQWSEESENGGSVTYAVKTCTLIPL